MVIDSHSGLPTRVSAPNLLMIAETAVTTRTSARLMTATVLALTARSAVLRAGSLDHLVGAGEQRGAAMLRIKDEKGGACKPVNAGNIALSTEIAVSATQVPVRNTYLPELKRFCTWPIMP